MKSKRARYAIKRRQLTWWWHYLPLHQGVVGGHLGPKIPLEPL
ncbi:MAG: hypothetical protein ACRCYV_01990 [Aeromonas sp.]